MENKSYSHGGEIYNKSIKYDFSVNMNPMGIANEVRSAAVNGLDLIGQYPDCELMDLYELASEKLGISSAEIVFGAGAEELIFATIASMSSGGAERVLLVSPIFTEYERAANAYGLKCDYYLLKEANDFVVTPEDVEGICSKISEYRAVVICNPGNPTGRLTDVNAIHKILCECGKTGVYLVVDESFHEMTDDNVQITDINDRLVIIRSLTKTYCIPGLRLGYAIVRDKIIMERIKSFIPRWSITPMAKAAGMEIFLLKGYRKESLELIKKEKDYLFGGLCKPCFAKIFDKIYDTDTCFFLVRSKVDLYGELLTKGILIRQCDEFDGLGVGYYRIAIKDRVSNDALIKAVMEIEV